MFRKLFQKICWHESFGFVTSVDLITIVMIIHWSAYTLRTETEEAKLINECDSQEPAVSSFTAFVIDAEHIFSSSPPPSCSHCSVWWWTESSWSWDAKLGCTWCFRERDDDALLIRNGTRGLSRMRQVLTTGCSHQSGVLGALLSPTGH